MSSALQTDIGQLDDKVCLEVEAKLLSYHTEGQYCLFEAGIPGFFFR